jgi:hypothetical protein
LDTFRLSDAAFGALAAGRPSAATIALLRRAQRSRHILLLSEVLRLSGGPLPPHGYAEPAALDDPMAALHSIATLAALRSGGTPPPPPVTATRHLTATHGGLTLRLRVEDADPLRHRLGVSASGPLTAAEAGRWQAHLDVAWPMLVTRHRPAAETIAAVLSVLVPLAPAGAAEGLSATSAEAFGAVAVSPPPDPGTLAVALVHETQHSVLNAVRVLFDLVGPPATPGYSPWRDDPRPPFGILHGAYAYQAVTRFWRVEAPHSRLAAFEFARWRAAVAAAADDLLAGGALTAAGRRFTGALRGEVARWLDDPVDAGVARLAAAANADHRARWRLRNLAVAPHTVSALAACRRAGTAPLPAPEPAVVPAAGRVLERSTRLDLVHRALRGDGPAGPASAGDTAYLAGDHATALAAYAKELERTPGDRAVWAGLSVVSSDAALRARPELVRAVFLALGAGDEVGSLARWLSH